MEVEKSRLQVKGSGSSGLQAARNLCLHSAGRQAGRHSISAFSTFGFVWVLGGVNDTHCSAEPPVQCQALREMSLHS